MSAVARISPVLDASKRDAFVEDLLEASGGVFKMFAIYLGDRLGLYDAMADGRLRTAAQLAERAGINPRYAREWLEQQTVCGVIEVDNAWDASEARRYRLPPEHAEALTERESLNYLAPLAQLLAGAVKPIERTVEAYRNGGGVPYEDYGRDLREGQGRMNRAMFLYQLGWEWLPSIPDVHARLQSATPARIADVGCGYGYSSIGMAKSYPHAVVDGFDLDEASVEEARRNAREHGVADRVCFHARDAGDPELGGRYDLVTALECVHDMSDPIGTLASARRMLRPGGSVIVADERVAERFNPAGGEIDWMMYGWSVLHCLPVGMADQPSSCTGTVMRPSTLERYSREAGFIEFEILPIDNFFLRFYRMR